MILLKSLQLRNFLSHAETFIEFTDGQKLLIDGNSGSGKSSIIEGLIWGLYGRGRTDNRSLVRKGAKGAFIQVVLTRAGEEGSEIIITRTVSDSGKQALTVIINGVAVGGVGGVRSLQNTIEHDIIGASYGLFCNSVAYLQDRPDTFVLQSATDRRELLLEIVKAEDYDKYHELARKRVEELLNKKQVSASKESELTRLLGVYSETIKSRPQLEEAVKKAKSEVEQCQNLKDINSKKIASMEGNESALSQAKSRVEVTKKSLSSAKEKIKRSESAKKELETLSKTEEEKASIDKDMDAINLEISGLEERVLASSEKTRQRAQILERKPETRDFTVNIESLKGDIANFERDHQCPSGNECPWESEKTQRISNAIGEIKRMELSMAADKEAIGKWQEEYDAVGIPESLKEMTESLTTLKGNRMDLVEKLDAVKNKLSDKKVLESLAAQLPQLIEEERSLASTLEKEEGIVVEEEKKFDSQLLRVLHTDRKIIEESLENARKNETASAIELDRVITLESTVVNIDTELKRLEIEQKEDGKMLAKMINLRDALGPKGLKGIVIDLLLPDLEEKINKILSMLSDFRVHLDTQQVKADGEGVKEGLFITIINEVGEEMPFESYSGGEKLKIVVSISEALATLQKVGFRIFDEVFVGLDENSTESFAIVLDKLQKRFNQVLCISHLQQIKDTFEEALMVTKNNGQSYVTKRS